MSYVIALYSYASCESRQSIQLNCLQFYRSFNAMVSNPHRAESNELASIEPLWRSVLWLSENVALCGIRIDTSTSGEMAELLSGSQKILDEAWMIGHGRSTCWWERPLSIRRQDITRRLATVSWCIRYQLHQFYVQLEVGKWSETAIFDENGKLRLIRTLKSFMELCKKLPNMFTYLSNDSWPLSEGDHYRYNSKRPKIYSSAEGFPAPEPDKGCERYIPLRFRLVELLIYLLDSTSQVNTAKQEEISRLAYAICQLYKIYSQNGVILGWDAVEMRIGLVFAGMILKEFIDPIGDISSWTFTDKDSAFMDDISYFRL